MGLIMNAILTLPTKFIGLGLALAAFAGILFGLPIGHAASAGGTAWRGRCLSMDRGTDEDVLYAATPAGLAEECARIADHPVVYQQSEIPCGLGMPGCNCVGYVLRAAGGVSVDYPIGTQFALCNGRKFTLQADGNLVLYGADGKPIWATWTYGRAVSRLAMQGDGNLVLYDASGSPVWVTGTSGNPGAFLALQEDGNVVLYDQGQKVLWSTATEMH